MAYHEASADSGGLCPSEMSDRELDILWGIESHFRNLPKRHKQPSEKVWQVAETRHARVILLDGDRGSGKTSLMLTMVERWNTPTFEQKGLAARYRDRVIATKDDSKKQLELEDPPKNVRVLSILDFDPLPPSMPVVAGLVQAWRRLAAELDRGMERIGHDSDDESVLDSWQNLFRTAATGWGELTARKSLVDQVLDQEEQIQDWDTLGLEWQKFIDKVIASGQLLPKSDPYYLSPNTVFVIMIDDCDLQVARMREILPAIRLLYDQNVFFIVSADRKHMLDTLELDYLGQQNQLSNRQMRDDPLLDNGRWARSLAEASFEKVFPTRHRHRLSRLSLSQVLEFPSGNTRGGATQSFGDLFEDWSWDIESARAEFRTNLLPDTDMPLSGYLRNMSVGIEGLDLRFPVATYRTAKQSWDRVQDFAENGPDRAAEAVARLLGGSDYEDLISRPYAHGDAQAETVGSPEAEDHGFLKGSHALPGVKSTPPRIVFNQQGQLTARYNEQLVVAGESDSKLSLSGSPAFGLVIPQSSTRAKRELGMGAGGEFSPLQAQTMLAVSLRDDFYHVDAPGMEWEMVRSLVWTTHQRPHVMQFNWPLLIHPSPLRLVLWSNEWRVAINRIRQRQMRKWSVAHAWLSHQLLWTGAIEVLPEMADPEKFNPEDFSDLLNNDKNAEWRQRVVPLLARPEIGLPVELQRLFLDHSDIADNGETLRQERRRLITDALLAGQPLNSENGLVEDEAGVTRIIEGFERQHSALHGTASPWSSRLEEGDKAPAAIPE